MPQYMSTNVSFYAENTEEADMVAKMVFGAARVMVAGFVVKYDSADRWKVCDHMGYVDFSFKDELDRTLVRDNNNRCFGYVKQPMSFTNLDINLPDNDLLTHICDASTATLPAGVRWRVSYMDDVSMIIQLASEEDLLLVGLNG